MSSIKLTKQIRRDIVLRAVKDVFTEREEALAARENALASAVYCTAISEADRRTIDALPEGFMREDNDVNARVAGQWVRLNFNSYRRCPNKMINSCWAVFDAGSAFADQHEAWLRDKQDCTAERQQLEVKIRALVDSCNTDTALLEAWPEAKNFLPERPTVTKTLPAVLASDVVASMAALKAKGRAPKLKIAKGA